MWFLALISSHQEVQSRAHAELDSVVGRVQKMSIASPTFELSSRRLAEKLHFMSCVSKVVYLLRWNVPTHHFGYRHRTIQLKTLYTTGCTSRRIQRSFSTVTRFITTRRDIRIRTHQLISVRFRSMLTSGSPTIGFPSNLSASWETH
jgi:hypothetical protein